MDERYRDQRVSTKREQEALVTLLKPKLELELAEA
jgi:hypothetical protein